MEIAWTSTVVPLSLMSMFQFQVQLFSVFFSAPCNRLEFISHAAACRKGTDERGGAWTSTEWQLYSCSCFELVFFCWGHCIRITQVHRLAVHVTWPKAAANCNAAAAEGMQCHAWDPVCNCCGAFVFGRFRCDVWCRMFGKCRPEQLCAEL